MISRRARREAAFAAPPDRPDHRLETAEHILAGFQVAANVFVLALSVLAWVWLGRQARPAAAGGRATPPDVPSGLTETVTAGALTAHPLLEQLVTASGATMVLIMLATCLLMAPVVNPFYAAPANRRTLHATTTVLFGVLAVTTVAVIAGAAR